MVPRCRCSEPLEPRIGAYRAGTAGLPAAIPGRCGGAPRFESRWAAPAGGGRAGWNSALREAAALRLSPGRSCGALFSRSRLGREREAGLVREPFPEPRVALQGPELWLNI